jgi:DNA-binding ferritin-like protein
MKHYVPDYNATTLEVSQLFNRNFADEYIIYLTTNDYFWNVTGAGSYRLCLMFERLNDASQLRLDLFAEKLFARRRGDEASYTEPNGGTRLHFTRGMGMPAEEMVSKTLALHESAMGLIHADIESINSLATGETVAFLESIIQAHQRTAELLRRRLLEPTLRR